MNEAVWSTYLSKTIHCDCSKEHICNIKNVLIHLGALDTIPGLLKSMECHLPCIVSDINTHKVAGERVYSLLLHAEYNVSAITFEDTQLIPDERAVGTILTRLDADCDLLVAVGSGTINDLCRFVSGRLGIKYIIIATAPSMDGYASSVSPLISDHIKTTFPSVVPQAIVGDTDILREAPMEMIAAGVADVLGKYICLADWRISHIVNGEYICPYVVGLVENNIKSVSSDMKNIVKRDSDAIKGVMDTLILSGMAISYIGNSRPASGSEHHLAHYWETVRLFDGKHDILHGTNVGVATVVCLAMYKQLSRLLPELEAHTISFDHDTWSKEIVKAYGSAAKGVIELEDFAGKNSPQAAYKRAHAVLQRRDEIIQIINALPEPEYIAGLLSSLGAPFSPAQVDVNDAVLRNSLFYAKDLRNRWGLLQLLYDFGIMEDMLDYTKKYFR